MDVLIVLLVIWVMIGLAIWVPYNGLVTLRNRPRNACRQIDDQLRRR